MPGTAGGTVRIKTRIVASATSCTSVERAGLSLLEAETETDRYISWPGQALSYMIGQREILALRAQLEERDGDRFDHQAFHDEVIGHGSLALTVLREQLPGWVAPKAD